MLFPETIFKYNDQAFRVWSTSATHIGFDCGYERGKDNDVPPITVNRVEYQVRFDANLQDDGSWAVHCESNAAMGWTSYWNTVYISRANWWGSGRDREPTDSARKKIVALAHEVLAAFVATDTAPEILRDGRFASAKMELDSATKALTEAKKALAVARDAFGDALVEAHDAGVDTTGVLFKSNQF